MRTHLGPAKTLLWTMNDGRVGSMELAQALQTVSGKGQGVQSLGSVATRSLLQPLGSARVL